MRKEETSMKIGVLGTGTVGMTISTKLAALGHQVTMGARESRNEKAAEWARKAGGKAGHGDFPRAASDAEIVFNCTSGGGAVAAVTAAGKESLKGKILIDLANPLDFSAGTPPRLLFHGEDSLGERIQNALPDTKVVKTLNTIAADVMVNPGLVPGEHDLPMCGNDAAAKARVTLLLREWFGWKSVIDLGPITASRGMEVYVLFWVHLMGALKTPVFNIHVQRKGA
jgi:8-hydroxy-5-deazaflavin:NADPH oxidoreductase